MNPRLIYIAIVAMAIATGIGIRWRSLEAGFLSDDYAQYAMLKGTYPVERSVYDLYSFVGGHHEVQKLMDFGAVPWWSHPDLRLSMMRPLSSILVNLDYTLFGKNIYGFHIHSTLWWILLIASVALVLRELLPMEIAAIAVILFAIEEGHNMSLTWLANRSALIALSLAWLGFWAHIIWRRRDNLAAFFISISLIALSLLAGEWAFPVFAYILAYELFGASGPWAQRIKALIPVSVLGLGFIVTQRVLHYGPVASEVYINPFSEPGVFLWQSLNRFASFFAEILFGIPVWWQETSPWKAFFLSWGIFTPKVWQMIPSWRFWHFIIGIIAVAVGYYVFRWSYHAQKPSVTKEMRWLLIGALLSLIPMVASFPSTRLIIPAFVGISACFSMAILHAFHKIRPCRTRDLLKTRTTRIAVAVFLLVGYFQVWKASAQSHRYIIQRLNLHRSIQEWALNAEIDDTKISKQDIFLINTIEHTIAVYFPFIRYFYGNPMPRSCRILSSAPKPHDIVRTGANQLDFIVLGGTILDGGIAKLYRADRYRFAANQTILLDGLKVQVINLYKQQPIRVRFTFNKPLEDPSYLFLHSTEDGMRKLILPKVGEQIRLPRAQFPDLRLLPKWKEKYKKKLKKLKKRK